jgi:lysophospholipase L1-like esterase
MCPWRRREQPYRRAARIGIAVGMAVMGVSAALASGLAQAATVPPSVPVRYYADLSPMPDSSVIADTAIASGGVPSGGAALQGIAADGTASWSVPYQNQEVIYPAPVADRLGNYYWTKLLPAGGYRLVASRGASELWSVPLPASGVQSLVVGADGNVYTWQGDHLYGYSATDHHLRFPPVSLAGLGGGSSDALFAYDNGIIAVSPSWAKYISYSGSSVHSPYRLTASATAFGAFAAQPNGNLYATGMTGGIPFGGCSDKTVNALVQKLSLDGKGWHRTLPWHSRCNGYGVVPNVLPDGGVVVSSQTDTGAGGFQYIDAQGAIGWYSQTSPPLGSGDPAVYPPQVDANGNIISERSFGFGCGLISDSCSGVQINELNAKGKTVGPSILLRGPTNANQQSWQPSPDGLALVPGHAYASLNHINGGIDFGTPSYGIYRFNIPRIGAEYPQSAIWRASVRNWVALGDSYSSGEGNPPFLGGSNVKGDQCHRSLAAYSEVISKQHSGIYHLSFHACSGALIKDMFSSNHNNSKEITPQLSWLSASTRIVTLTIGGNDAHFADVLNYCARRVPYQPSCKSIWGGAVDSAITNMSIGTGRAHDNYPDLFAAIKKKAPDARVYVLGYPRFFPPNQTATCPTGFPGFTHLFTASDMHWINSEIAKLDTLIKMDAIASGFTYVGEYGAMGRHELCTKHPWFYSARLPKASSFHPNKSGQSAMAAILEKHF